jgi:hypothetical protein
MKLVPRPSDLAASGGNAGSRKTLVIAAREATNPNNSGENPRHTTKSTCTPGQIRDPNVLTNPLPHAPNLSGHILDKPPSEIDAAKTACYASRIRDSHTPTDRILHPPIPKRSRVTRQLSTNPLVHASSITANRKPSLPAMQLEVHRPKR